MDNLFEAADSGDVLAHPHIINTHIYTHTKICLQKKNSAKYFYLTFLI